MTGHRPVNRMWGGRFRQKPHDLMQSVNASIDFDRRLYRQDILGSIAHSRMLARMAIISHDDADAIQKGLNQVLVEIENGEFKFSRDLEDIHMNIEARLAELTGQAAGRLHTARSRNDQVATDLRMWVRDHADSISGLLATLISGLLDQASRHHDAIMPGFTHLQNAQPVTFGHHLMAYVEMFGRDIERYTDARSRLNKCPLGCAALAGTAFPVDREYTSSELGFDAPMDNSMDAVSDRDFVMEFLSCASICAVHLSRLADEIVMWSSPQFGFIRLGDEYSTGSSIMPQKRNPDAAELVRAKSGRVFGALISILSVVKSLPLTYSKDLQEDKELLFDATDTMGLSLRVMDGMVRNLEADRCAMLAAAGKGHSTATDLADMLVMEGGMAFRSAHHVVGQLVREAESRNCSLDEVPVDAMKAIHPALTSDIRSRLTVEKSVASRKSHGGTAPGEVSRQIARWKEKIRTS